MKELLDHFLNSNLPRIAIARISGRELDEEQGCRQPRKERRRSKYELAKKTEQSEEMSHLRQRSRGSSDHRLFLISMLFA